MQSSQLLLLLFLAIPTAARADGAFLDATLAAGVSYLQHQANPFESCLLIASSFCAPERMAGGAAVADVGGDGDLDLFAVNNASTPVLYQNQTRAVGGPQWLRVRVLVRRAASG